MSRISTTAPAAPQAAATAPGSDKAELARLQARVAQLEHERKDLISMGAKLGQKGAADAAIVANTDNGLTREAALAAYAQAVANVMAARGVSKPVAVGIVNQEQSELRERAFGR